MPSTEFLWVGQKISLRIDYKILLHQSNSFQLCYRWMSIVRDAKGENKDHEGKA